MSYGRRLDMTGTPEREIGEDLVAGWEQEGGEALLAPMRLIVLGRSLA